MPVVDFDERRAFDAEQFRADEAFRTDRMTVMCGFFEPGQFIPVHAPGSDLVVRVRSGRGIVREGDTDHAVEAGDVVVVAADTDRGIRADEDTRLEALLVVAPPPTEAEHAPVRRGLRENEFDPEPEAGQ